MAKQLKALVAFTLVISAQTLPAQAAEGANPALSPGSELSGQPQNRAPLGSEPGLVTDPNESLAATAAQLAASAAQAAADRLTDSSVDLEQLLQEALAADDGSWAFQNNIGVAYLYLNRFADADQAFANAIALAPQEAIPSYLNRALALRGLGRFQAAAQMSEAYAALIDPLPLEPELPEIVGPPQYPDFDLDTPTDSLLEKPIEGGWRRPNR